MSAREIQQALRQAVDPTRAAFAPRFFKTGPGEYGEGDEFLGVPVPQQRAIAAKWRTETLPELSKLLESSIHEERLTALLILVHQYQMASGKRGFDADVQAKLCAFYLEHLDAVNNWDLVDSSAPQIFGAYLLTQPKGARKQLLKLAQSKSRWHRRIALLTTQVFIRDGQFADTLHLAELLLADREDLIHKAAGWMLREVGQRDVSVLRGFLDQHAPVMPRTMLRYALEKLPAAERKRYLNVPRPAVGPRLA
jgi:3-methyladenine DNA glycosylase AlkD